MDPCSSSVNSLINNRRSSLWNHFRGRPSLATMATQLTSFDAYLDLSSSLKESVPTLDMIFSALKLDRPPSAQEVKLPTEDSTNLLEKERLTSAVCPPLPMTNAVGPECRPVQRVPRNVASGTLLNRRNTSKKIPQSQILVRRSSRVVRPSFLSRFSMDGLYGTTETTAAQVAHDLKRERIAAEVRFGFTTD